MGLTLAARGNNVRAGNTGKGLNAGKGSNTAMGSDAGKGLIAGKGNTGKENSKGDTGKGKGQNIDDIESGGASRERSTYETKAKQVESEWDTVQSAKDKKKEKKKNEKENEAAVQKAIIEVETQLEAKSKELCLALGRMGVGEVLDEVMGMLKAGASEEDIMNKVRLAVVL